ncbi:MAG: hypothetical protein WCO88_16800, partial [Actinomycetota bacterium]
MTFRHRSSIGLAILAVAAVACSSTTSAPAPATTAVIVDSSAATTAPTAPATTQPLAAATFTVQPGSGQVAVLDAQPGTELTLTGPSGTPRQGKVDDQGSLLFRTVAPGDGYVITSAKEASKPFTIADPAVNPDTSWY